LQPRVFMNLQTKAVACPVKESNPAPFAHFSWKASFCEQILDGLVDRRAVGAVLDPPQRHLLPCLDRLPQLPLRIAGSPPHHRPGEITKVSGFCVAREDVENDQRIRLQWS